jgi:hypothetical protein
VSYPGEIGWLEVLVFEIEGRSFGLAASVVQELLRAVAVTPMPGKNHDIAGVIDLRGRLVDVIDVRFSLGLPKREIMPSDQFVIANTDDGPVALSVDRASELVRLPVYKGRASRDSALRGIPIDAMARHPSGPVPILSIDFFAAPTRVVARVRHDPQKAVISRE